MFFIITIFFFFFFNDTATTEIYTLSLHDALPISDRAGLGAGQGHARAYRARASPHPRGGAGRVTGVSSPSILVVDDRSEEHTSELQSQSNLVCRLLLEKKKKKYTMQFCSNAKTKT